ncbi:hypothetical protein AADZ84_09045 [Colwelliaceae bacterium MEBiC 14330]
MIFSTAYGQYTSYETYRDALIAQKEHAVLFREGVNALATDLDNYSDNKSIAIGYGFDLLVRSNKEINEYFTQANTDSNEQQQQIREVLEE